MMADMLENNKRSLYLFELSDVFDNQVYLPYSSGVVASYIFANQEISENYKLADWFYYRQEVEDILTKIENPSVVGFSCFVWNWNINLALAKAIKEKFPNCLIVFGGQQQPLADRVGSFFIDHSYVDVLVHGEGEETFLELLLELLKPEMNLMNVSGISFNSKLKSSDTKQKTSLAVINNKAKDDNIFAVKTPERPRMRGISHNPSPYLDGLFDRVVAAKPESMSFSAIVESARGCPYRCAFCEIGEQYYTKVEKSYDKIKEEINWIISNQIEYITDANSNYGLYYDLDLDLANFIKQRKEETGFPHAYRVTWAKGGASKVLDIANVFETAGVQKGVTIALQSMNPDVLDAIKRKNIDGGKLKEFIELYEKKNISSYVELIWGLPNETLNSFVDGMCSIAEMGYHNYLDIHLMAALINTPFSRPEYIEKYGIETSTTQPFFHHRHIDSLLSDDTTKFVTKTNTFTQEEWIEGHHYRWLVIFGHYLGPTQFISRFLRKYIGISYKNFYTEFLNYAKSNPESFIGKQYYSVDENLRKILKNQRHWGVVLPELSEINWSFEEGSAINVAMNYDAYQTDMKNFLINVLKAQMDERVLNEVLEYQRKRLNYPCQKVNVHQFNYNIHDFIENDDYNELIEEKTTLQMKYCNIDDFYNWAKKILWFGRRTGDYKAGVTKL